MLPTRRWASEGELERRPRRVRGLRRWTLCLVLSAAFLLFCYLCLAPVPSFLHPPPEHALAHPRAAVHPRKERVQWRLLVATNTRLFWYDTHRQDDSALHAGEVRPCQLTSASHRLLCACLLRSSGLVTLCARRAAPPRFAQGVYYGLFPGEDPLGEDGVSSVWVVSRPLVPPVPPAAAAREWLLQLNVTTGAELRRVRLPTAAAHDAIRQGSSVWVCSTGKGQLLQYSFPEMRLKRTLALFRPDERVNSLAALGDGSLWAVLQNTGEARGGG